MAHSSAIARALSVLAGGGRLGEALTHEAFGQVMRGEAALAQIRALLVGLRVQGETADEVVGAVRALREAMVAVPVTDQTRLVDTCGTGGGSVTTFNISTAAAFVAAASGAVVAKHGNRSHTSKCGSADVLEALGISIAVDAERAAQLLDEVGMAFLFAPAFHPAMRHVAPVRRELGVPTIMNIIGPLANPAGVMRQLIGVADVWLAPLVAEVLSRLDTAHALVVHADVGMDEISPVGTTSAWEVRGGDVTEFSLDPSTYGLGLDDLVPLTGGDPEENAARLEQLLNEPQGDPAGRSAVALNAGASLYVAGRAKDLEEGMQLAVSTLDNGKAAGALEQLRQEAGVSTSESRRQLPPE